MAVSRPKAGEIARMTIPDIKYHATVMIGPSHPTSSASFLEKRKMSNIGLVMFKYKVASDYAHFSASYVSLWSGLAILESRLVIL